MKYYVVADVHGFYSLLRETLEKKGFFEDAEPRKLILLGDLFDRGSEAEEMQDFVLGLMERDEVILVRGNHEDCITELADNFKSYLLGNLEYTHHYVNGTIDTAARLTGLDMRAMREAPYFFVSALRGTPYMRTVIPAMADWFETENYVFTHGWIPCARTGTHGKYVYSPAGDWRKADKYEWEEARWYNGMDAVRTVKADGKTVVCGHRTASYGHSKYEGRGSEFGKDADYSPYYADGIIAIDACTAVSGKMNCIVIEDEPTGQGSASES